MKRITTILALLGALLPALQAAAQDPAPAASQAASAAASAAAAAEAASAPAPAIAAASAPAAPVRTQVSGLWCGSGPLHEFSLRLTQRQQDVEGELVRRDRARTIQGRIEGNVLRTQSTKVGALVLERHGDQLKVTDGDGPLALVRGQVFRRTDAPTCAG
ncbi:hypothetical protein ACPWT1_10850 [Ramlibacter sp. MMS24-I3-19]|uniref:hypothetical protein n=1 Tax=Ramlibacter sp. MMS24-I3-19 TaxID=3416606 RepID=UPI003D00F96F